MSNYKLVVEDLDKRVKTGLLDNTEQEVSHGVRHLLLRIEELTKALIPFAAVGNRDNFGDSMVQVYYADTQKARDVLDSAQSYTPHVRSSQDVQNYYPAE